MLTKLKFTSYLLISIILTFVLSLSLQSVLADWTAPLSAPPDDSIKPPVYNSKPQANNGVLIATSTIIGGTFGVSENLIVNGNVGIGITSPSYKLDVYGTIRATAFLYSSDKSLKDNIKPIDNALEKVLALDGVSFNWKEDGSASLGVIAQDLETVFPELVKTDTQTGLKSVEYGNLVAPLIEAIKEQQAEIKELQNNIEILNKKCDF